MARSSTTFQKGNRLGFQPGNQLALKHGLFSRLRADERLPAIRAWLEERLAENPIPAQGVDEPLKFRYCWLAAYAISGMEGFNDRGGVWTEDMNLKKGADALMRIYDRLEKMERVMGIGALPRAQTAQLQANANLNQTEVLAAEERLAARRQLRLGAGAGAR